MQIIYNNVDITDDVHPLRAVMTDHASGKPDKLDLLFSDTEGLWSKWAPAKGDTVRIYSDPFDSGQMYIDEISQVAGGFGIGALSIPQECKTARSQGWENVRFMEIATQISARYGFQIKTFGVTNYLYDRVDQSEVADISFLADRCILEGYGLKISDETLIIYSEQAQESAIPDPQLATIDVTDINGSFKFLNKSVDVYSKCIVRSYTADGYIEGVHTDTNVSGPTLIKQMYASNQAEADRWAKGLLRSNNKLMITGQVSLNLNTNYAAGTMVKVENVGMFDGDYFIHFLTHDLINNRSKLQLRKPLEGY